MHDMFPTFRNRQPYGGYRLRNTKPILLKKAMGLSPLCSNALLTLYFSSLRFFADRLAVAFDSH